MNEELEIKTLSFNHTTCVLNQYVVESGTVWHLNFHGLEIGAKSLAARLNNGAYRSKPNDCRVQINDAVNIALESGHKYRQISAPLAAKSPNDPPFLDVAISHPALWADYKDVDEKSFRLLSLVDDDTMPDAFFEWFTQRCDIPLDPAWGEWLWEEGLQKNGYCTVASGAGVVKSYRQPIRILKGYNCRVYLIMTDLEHTEVWLTIIRQHLGLQPEAMTLNGKGEYVSKNYTIKQVDKEWGFFENEAPTYPRFVAESFPELFVMARQQEGYDLELVVEATPEEQFREWCKRNGAVGDEVNAWRKFKFYLDTDSLTDYLQGYYKKVLKRIDFVKASYELMALPKL